MQVWHYFDDERYWLDELVVQQLPQERHGTIDWVEHEILILGTA